MFTNEYSHSVDSKGRIVLPSKFREELGDEFFITYGNLLDPTEPMLCVYSDEGWKNLAAKLSKIPSSKKLPYKIATIMFSGTTCTPDKNGRVLIPDSLRKYAKLDKDVVSIGRGDHIQIWDSELWYSFKNQLFTADEIDELREELASYDI
jgi:MraZ protein